MDSPGGSRALVNISFNGDFYHVMADTTGKTSGDALDLAKSILKMLTEGKETYIRAAPSVEVETNYETGITSCRGFVRFSFRDVPGDVENLAEFEGDDLNDVSFGDAGL